jgi:hypothetical protein
LAQIGLARQLGLCSLALLGLSTRQFARAFAPAGVSPSARQKKRSAMPKRTDISTILIIGAGPIVIGQACEFDYSGTQACKALKAEGYRIVLVNSNPATIMTDPDLAHATYIEPITPEVVEKIIEKERTERPARNWCCCRPWAARPRSTPRSPSTNAAF